MVELYILSDVKKIDKMRNLQVFSTAFVVVICLFVTMKEVNGLKYSVDGLKSAVNYQCCVKQKALLLMRYEINLETGLVGVGKRGIREQMPLQKESKAKRFLGRLMTRGSLFEECCNESCSQEEMHEGSANTPDELREECLHEGCSIHEIYEHC